MKYYFLVNPCSGSGKGKQVWQQVATYLATTAVDYNSVLSKYPGHPHKIAAELAPHHQEIDCLVVIGGDGTLHEVISGLIDGSQNNRLPVAYIPAGTGNDFARGYGISTRPLEALQQILQNRQERVINVGHYYDSLSGQQGIFLNNFGIGFDAAIVHATNNSRAKDFLNHHHLGTFSYIFKAVKVLFTQPPFSVRINDRQDFTHAFLLVASNHPFIGGGIKVAPGQRVDKRQLELVVVEKHHWLTLIWSMLMFAGGHLPASRYAHVFRGTQLKYQIKPAQYGQIDGEEPGKHAFNLELTCCDYPFWQKQE